MSDTEKHSWEWQQEIQETVLLYQSQLERVKQQLASAQARIAELEQECARLSVFHADDEPSWRHLAEKLKQQLAAMTQERDTWRSDASSHLQALCEKQMENNGLKQQLAAIRQARKGQP